MTQAQAEQALQAYPNLRAVLIGAVSGAVGEWSMLRSELLKLAEELDMLRVDKRHLVQSLAQVLVLTPEPTEGWQQSVVAKARHVLAVTHG